MDDQFDGCAYTIQRCFLCIVRGTTKRLASKALCCLTIKKEILTFRIQFHFS